MSDGNFTGVGSVDDDFLNFTDVDDIIDDIMVEEEDYWPAYLTWIQKVFASLSIICSYVICRETLSDFKNQQSTYSRGRSTSSRGGRPVKLQQSIGRILLQLSISDIIFSFAVFLGEWPAPKDTLYIHHAAGNKQLCTFQAWMRALGYVASPMFSVALNAFYLLLIRWRWQDSQLSRLEKKVTIAIWVYALILSIIPIPLDAYNSDWDVCWIAPVPLDCVGDECTSGRAAEKIDFFYIFFHIWACVLACVVLMFLLFKTVRNLEDKSNAYNTTSVRQMVDSSKSNACASGSEPDKLSGNGEEEEISNSVIPLRDSSNRSSKLPKDNSKRSSKLWLEAIGETDRGRHSSSVMEPTAHTDSKNTAVVTIPKGSDEAQTNDSDRIYSGRTHSGRTQVDVEQPAPQDNRKSSLAQSSNRFSHRKSRAVAYQGILYTLAFLTTHLFDMIARLTWKIAGMWYLNFDIVAYMVMQPALGIFNFVIFSRNRKNMATPEGRFLRKIVCCCDGFGLLYKRHNDEEGHQTASSSGHGHNHSSTHRSQASENN